MTDHPILFSAPMVRALLEGRKTQTRRLITRARVFATPECRAFTLKGAQLERAMQNASSFRHLGGNGWHWEADAFEWQAPNTRTTWNAHIGYAVGDVLWVREAFHVCKGAQRWKDGTVLYRADHGITHGGSYIDCARWKPSIHMPRWASRITLRVTDVRVQRLQEISEEDARAEGVAYDPAKGFVVPGVAHPNPAFPYLSRPTAFEMFAALWDTVNGSGAWGANPWVAAYSFDRMK